MSLKVHSPESPDTLVEQDRPVNGFDHVEQGDFLRVTRQCDAAACSTGGMQQPGNG